MLLVAIGRRPVTENIGLEALGIELERGYVKVNPYMQHGGAAHLRHRRRDQHALAGARRLGRGHPGRRAHGRAGGAADQLRPRPLLHLLRPRGGERRPHRGQGARAGLRRQGRQVPLHRPRQGQIIGKTAGFVKLSRETKYDEVLGVHIIGAHATDLIAEACVALQLEGDRRGADAHHARPPDPVRGGHGGGPRRPRRRHPHVEGKETMATTGKSWGPLHPKTPTNRPSGWRRPTCRASGSSSSTTS